MPTGYTSGVATGEIKDFKTYALQCARAFGACIMLRDEPMSDEIPKFKALEMFQQAANIGQVYSIAAMIRTAAEEAQAIGGLCLEKKHVEGIGLMASQANALCAVLMAEWDKIKAEILAAK